MPLITTDLHKALSDLNKGKPVAIPTETVYGLAAKIDNDTAIQAVFEMKNRPLDHPLIVHVAKDWDLELLVDSIPDYAKKMINHWWPGPLTLVLLSKANAINPIINGGQNSVAIRCPAHPMAQELLKQLQVPIVAPSANPFGKISPTTALHVKQSFEDKSLTILDGGRCTVGIESTIVDARKPDSYQILRQGSLDESTISSIMNIPYITHESALRVPGKLESHYQPQKTLYYFEHYENLSKFCNTQKQSVYVIASKKPDGIKASHFHPMAIQPDQAAYELYFQLRKADASESSCIAIELPPNSSQWLGVRERILKAGNSF